MTATAIRTDARPAGRDGEDQPVFGFILVGGGLQGAVVRDIRLANELARRGYRVHVWWAMDRPRQSPLRSEVEEHWLFSGMRYAGWWPRTIGDAIGRFFSAVTRDKNRARAMQKRAWLVSRMMERVSRLVVDGVEHDPAIVNRLARELDAAGVTHLLPMLGLLCPWASAARDRCTKPLRYLVTFQGYELYANYARAIGCEEQLYDRMRTAVEQSDFPAIAVSEDYLQRVVEDIGVPESSMVAIPPGVPTEILELERPPLDIVRETISIDPDLPLVTFLGRRDTEKGIDLLLYAASILRARGLEFQVAVVGPTLFGKFNDEFCKQLSRDLRCPVGWRNQVSDEVRTALFMYSRCIVYPSIHREPFGMVAVEVLAHGTPAIVPDRGGIAGAIEGGGECGGLHFRIWDSGHLAEQMARLLTDDELHRRLCEAGPRVATHYSVALLADRVLAHIGLAEPVASPT